MKKPKTLKLIVLVFLVQSVFFCMNSCVSLKVESNSDYISILNDISEADAFFQIPIKQNYDYCVALLEKSYNFFDKKSFENFSKRCDTFYASFTTLNDEETEFYGVLTGNFWFVPKTYLENFDFGKDIKAEFLSNSLILFTNQDISQFKTNFSKSFFAQDASYKPCNVEYKNSDIFFYTKDFQDFASKTKFIPISFGFEEAYLKIWKGKTEYKAQLQFELIDARTANVAIFLLNKTFPNSYISVENENYLKVSNIQGIDEVIISQFLKNIGGKK